MDNNNKDIADDLPVESWNQEPLPPEMKEMIAQKTQDILDYGVPYTCVLDADKLENIFREGILGMPRYGPLKNTSNRSPEEWKKAVRWKENQVTASFNIRGRSLPWRHAFRLQTSSDDLIKKIIKRIPEDYFSCEWFDLFGKGNQIAIIFDISDMKEGYPRYIYEKNNSDGTSENWEPIPRWSFAIRGPKEYISSRTDKNGNLLTSSEYGFSFPNRIAPRRFRGMVVKDENMVDKIVSAMLAWGKCIIPVYNIYGDMIWPKKIPHSEITKNQK